MSTTPPTHPQSLEAKIVVLGAAGVGKTSLLTRFIHGTFPTSSSVTSTVGATFLTKRLTSPDDAATTLRLQIWDTAGQERFRSISKLYYRGANAALLCYDITDEASFLDMTRWLEELRENLGEGCVVHVVGTKADVVAEDPRKRQVGFERCIAYVAEHLQKQQGSGGGGGGAGQHTAGLASSIASTASTSTSTTPFLYSNTTTTPTPLIQQPPSISSTSTSSTTTKEKRPLTPPSHNNLLPILHQSSPTRTPSTLSWAQDASWNCCHEISAKDGEGVEEVFRVIARKLVEQQLSLLSQQQGRRRYSSTDEGGGGAEKRYGNGNATWGSGPGGRGGDGRGSFRLGPSGNNSNGSGSSGGGGGGGGMGDKRRSWLGFPGFPIGRGGGGGPSSMSSSGGYGHGCGHGNADQVGISQVYNERYQQQQQQSQGQGQGQGQGGRCC